MHAMDTPHDWCSYGVHVFVYNFTTIALMTQQIKVADVLMVYIDMHLHMSI